MFKDIGNYLARFANFTLPDQYIKDAISTSIKKTTGITIKSEAIEIKGTSAFVTAYPPAVKNEILLHRSEILSQVESISQKRHIRDIR